jgi:hypothetical protein
MHISGNSTANNITNKAFSYEVLGLGPKTEITERFSTDSVVSYHAVQNHFKVQITPNSGFGYYAFISGLLFLLLGIAVLWNFKKIFKETNLDHPFKASITRRLKILATIFIVSDVLKILNYIIFNSLLHQSVSSPRFELLTDIGNGIITGLIIFVISIVYERGTTFQEETALTV